MSTAVESRVRQIAILVSSVDAAAARQLLMHLPTDLAKQVRRLVTQLGPISAAEKSAILAEFQKSATESHASPVPNAAGGQPARPATGSPPAVAHAASEDGLGRAHEAFSGAAAAVTASDDPSAAEPLGPAWTRLSTESLLRFVRGERTVVIAVVLSQLAPHKAVDVLRGLPPEVHAAVLRQLSNMQAIDPEATAAIDEHLAERLKDYEHRFESERENSRRLAALLAAAPADLRQQWQTLLSDDQQAATHRNPAAPSVEDWARDGEGQGSGRGPEASPVLHEAPARTLSVEPPAVPRSAPSLHELYGNSVYTTSDAPEPTAATRAAPTPQESPASGATILPFPASAESDPATQRSNDVDRAFLQADFEQLLTLSHQQLAQLLSQMDSRTVLLALAGSSPEFMRRFTRMLEAADAKALTQRLQLLGAIKLRDVDTAQRRIIEAAADWLPQTAQALDRMAA